MKRMNSQWLLWIYALVFGLFALSSYALTEPNLVISSHPLYWQFQQWIWQMDRQLLALGYGLFIITVCIVYTAFARQLLHSSSFSPKRMVVPLVFMLAFLGISYNALSHDVFNYMFNARMVIEYGANPHIQTALDFASDDWVRFMHNIHTPAPYWYGWTGVSLIPYILGLEKFLITWLAFRAWSVLGLILLAVFLWKLIGAEKGGGTHRVWWLLLFLNPLVLIEGIANVHNDAWMMWPAVASLWLLRRIKWKPRQRSTIFLTLSLSLSLLLFSLSIKIATIVLLPFWIYLVLRERKQFQHCFTSIAQRLPFAVVLQRWGDAHLYDLMSMALFVPLLTTRAQQFHPWYLLWPLTFLPLLRLQWWRTVLLIFSFSSLLRYIPWIAHGAFEFTPEIQLTQRLITFGPAILYICYQLLLRAALHKQQTV